MVNDSAKVGAKAQRKAITLEILAKVISETQNDSEDVLFNADFIRSNFGIAVGFICGMEYNDGDFEQKEKIKKFLEDNVELLRNDLDSIATEDEEKLDKMIQELQRICE